MARHASLDLIAQSVRRAARRAGAHVESIEFQGAAPLAASITYRPRSPQEEHKPHRIEAYGIPVHLSYRPSA